MLINWIRYSSVFLLLVFLQVCIFNRIHLFGYATPILYIYFIIKLPINLNRNWVILIAFALGLIIDRFEFFFGFNALASTVVGFLRYYGLKLFTPREIDEASIPSINTLGTGFFIRYAGSLVLIHQLILFYLESDLLANPITFLLKVSGSFIITMLLIYAVEGVNLQFRKK